MVAVCCSVMGNETDWKHAGEQRITDKSHTSRTACLCHLPCRRLHRWVRSLHSL